MEHNKNIYHTLISCKAQKVSCIFYQVIYTLLYTDPDRASTGEMAYTLHKPHLELLWQYTCKLTKGRPALCMTWNKLNMVRYGGDGLEL